jgi:hypothetical protein
MCGSKWARELKCSRRLLHPPYSQRLCAVRLVGQQCSCGPIAIPAAWTLQTEREEEEVVVVVVVAVVVVLP